MIFKKFLILLFFVFSSTILAQNQKQIDFYKSKFYEYQSIGIDSALFYTEKVFTSKRPIDLAFAYAAKWQLLFVSNQEYDEKDFLQKIKLHLKQVPNVKQNYYDLASVYNIVGNTFYKKDQLSEGLTNFLEAEKFAVSNGDINQIIKIKGNIASIKGDLNLVDDAIKSIKSVLVLINNNENKIQKEKIHELKVRNKLNLGTFYITKLTVFKTKSYADSAKAVFNELIKGQIEDYYKAKVYSKLGILYTETKEFSKGALYYKKGIAIFSKIGEEKEIITNRYNLGFNQFQAKKFNEAKKNFLAIVNQRKDTLIDFNFLFAHKYLASIYSLEKSDSAVYYIDRFTTIYSKKTEGEKIEIAKSFNKIEKKDLIQEVKKLKSHIDYSSNIKNMLLILVLMLVFILIFLFFNYRKNKKETEIKLNKLLEKVVEYNETKPKSFSKLKITNENEQKIIEGLEKLEREKYFLRSDFNLHNVAKKIGSNTTYLTSVIKTYKEMSFNDYTNELRVNYILNQLLVDKKLQNYTIQSLAEHIGYKKGASFSKIFKQKTGVTPFQYIEKLKSNS